MVEHPESITNNAGIEMRHMTNVWYLVYGYEYCGFLHAITKIDNIVHVHIWRYGSGGSIDLVDPENVLRLESMTQ